MCPEVVSLTLNKEGRTSIHRAVQGGDMEKNDGYL